MHLVNETHINQYEEVIGVEAIKERVRKRSEMKMQNLYKNVDSESPEVQLR